MEKSIGVALVLALFLTLVLFPFTENYSGELLNPNCKSGYVWDSQKKRDVFHSCEREKEKRLVFLPVWTDKPNIEKNMPLFIVQLGLTALVFGYVAYFIGDLSNKRK